MSDDTIEAIEKQLRIDAILEAKDCEALEANPALKKIFTTLKQNIDDGLDAVDACNETDTMRLLVLTKQVLTGFEREMMRTIQTGKMAEQAIQDELEEKEQEEREPIFER